MTPDDHAMTSSGASTSPEPPVGKSADEAATALPAELLEIRRSIDNIDAALIHLLAERFSHTQRVGRLKARHGLPPADPAREAVQIERLRSLAAGARLDPDFAEKFLGFLVEEVIRHHRDIARKEGREDGAAATGPGGAGPRAGSDESFPADPAAPDASGRGQSPNWTID
ncbi:chorismate mutase [Mobilicoccus massiliensis]|uniref:chorismate mutase n=1 Tax=Mobilicoccus massiliensis TaxID=1522310 RepID=UPI000AE7FD7E